MCVKSGKIYFRWVLKQNDHDVRIQGAEIKLNMGLWKVLKQWNLIISGRRRFANGQDRDSLDFTTTIYDICM